MPEQTGTWKGYNKSFLIPGEVMNCTEMIEEIVDLATNRYKKLSKGSREYDLINQHKEVVIDGVSFHYWREYGVYKVCEYLKEKVPEADVECTLDGNSSNIIIGLSDEEEKLLNPKLNKLIKDFLN